MASPAVAPGAALTVIVNDRSATDGVSPPTEMVIESDPAVRAPATSTNPVLELIEYFPPASSDNDQLAVPVVEPEIEAVPTSSPTLALSIAELADRII